MQLHRWRQTSVSRRFAVIFSVLGLLSPAWPTGAAESLSLDQPQLAGISGFRAFWDTPIVLAGEGLVVETKHTPGGTGPNAVWAPEQRGGGTQPGAIVFDAVHRSVLVRFPGSAQRIADEVRQGFAIEKVVLDLPHRATELWAEGYAEPDEPHGSRGEGHHGGTQREGRHVARDGLAEGESAGSRVRRSSRRNEWHIGNQDPSAGSGLTLGLP